MLPTCWIRLWLNSEIWNLLFNNLEKFAAPVCYPSQSPFLKPSPFYQAQTITNVCRSLSYQCVLNAASIKKWEGFKSWESQLIIASKFRAFSKIVKICWERTKKDHSFESFGGKRIFKIGRPVQKKGRPRTFWPCFKRKMNHDHWI